VFLYAVGSEHPYRAACREIVGLAASGALLGDASVELVQEFVHVRTRRLGDRRESTEAGREIGTLCRLHPLEPEDLMLGLELFEESTHLDLRDALHAATALNRGIGLIVSTDRAFDGVAGLERVDPLRAVERLTER
jgi:predicted nucleic acid-binding protein